MKERPTENTNLIQGRIWVLGDSIDTDLIVPSRVLTEQNEQKLLDATLENIIPRFSTQVKKGDIILAGRNFGCGSSREEAVFVLKKLGISTIIAESFARIFFRNAINLGLPPIQIKNAKGIGKTGDILKINLQEGTIYNQNSQEQFLFEKFPPFFLKFLE